MGNRHFYPQKTFSQNYCINSEVGLIVNFNVFFLMQKLNSKVLSKYTWCISCLDQAWKKQAILYNKDKNGSEMAPHPVVC